MHDSRFGRLFPGRNLEGFSALDVIHAEGSPLQALLYAGLFWPDFVEIDGMVFLSDMVSTAEALGRVKASLASSGQNRAAVEAAFNVIEVPTLFGRHIGDTTDDEDRELCGLLAVVWRYRLLQLFPERTFVVQVLSCAETGGEIGLQFSQA